MNVKALKRKWHKDVIRDNVREMNMDEQRLGEKGDGVADAAADALREPHISIRVLTKEEAEVEDIRLRDKEKK